MEYYYRYDPDGNIIQGQTQWSARTEAFGQTHITLDAINNPLRFPGQYHDPETDLHHNWNRDYNPNLGRYIQSDPIGLEGGVNVYGYANASPIILIDPNGESAFCYFKWIFIGGLGGAATGCAFGAAAGAGAGFVAAGVGAIPGGAIGCGAGAAKGIAPGLALGVVVATQVVAFPSIETVLKENFWQSMKMTEGAFRCARASSLNHRLWGF